ncbi:zinc finger protein 135-like [Melanotaenia boesemani]|uniref:zinc finger protein 135-like n=1 Tax=Melanotaenia boesemani TaxID=1250792 RepID=UPI001C056561|nr:zinc finger protein 135-like [Melanotaenia boesemani]
MSLQHLRNLINERLTAAAEEIFTEFEKVIVQYEVEIDRQRRLLETSNLLKILSPQIKLHRIDLPQQHDLKEKEVQIGQYHQDEISSVDQGIQVPPKIKEELQELSTSRYGEQVVLQEEADTFMMTPIYEVSHQNEPDFLLGQEEQVPQGIKEDRDELGISQQEEQLVQTENVDTITMAPVHGGSHRTEPKFLLDQQKQVPPTMKPLSCEICGKGFSRSSFFYKHMRIHTKKTPYFCSKCCMYFKKNSSLLNHQRYHVDNMPFACETCGRGFRVLGGLTRHRRHRARNPYPCEICCNSFIQEKNLNKHKLIHKDLSQKEVRADQHMWTQAESVRPSHADQHLPSTTSSTESRDLMGGNCVVSGSVVDSEQKTETSLCAHMTSADPSPV